MNQNWKDFLSKTNTTHVSDEAILFPDSGENSKHSIYPIASLAVLSVSGVDAAHFLQGQITCDINEITESKSSFGAFCTAKGRAISTFLITNKDQRFLIILPTELLDIVKKRLQLYILRADVQLTDSRNEYCLIGLDCPDKSIASQALPQKEFDTEELDNGICISLPSPQPRYLAILAPATAINLWTELTANNNFTPVGSDRWKYLDILSGIPWLNLQTSEEFIPQMLNLDQLGGISFKKGCYTGQEIVARTHYLGKSKRKMYLAECQTAEQPALNSAIIDVDDSNLKVGSIVLIEKKDNEKSIMLCVLQSTHAQSTNLRLQNRDQTKIIITELFYSI